MEEQRSKSESARSNIWLPHKWLYLPSRTVKVRITISSKKDNSTGPHAAPKLQAEIEEYDRLLRQQTIDSGTVADCSEEAHGPEAINAS